MSLVPDWIYLSIGWTYLCIRLIRARARFQNCGRLDWFDIFDPPSDISDRLDMFGLRIGFQKCCTLVRSDKSDPHRIYLADRVYSTLSWVLESSHSSLIGYIQVP
jgi:hypothetical protein